MKSIYIFNCQFLKYEEFYIYCGYKTVPGKFLNILVYCFIF